MKRARCCSSAGSLAARIEIKMMLSMPRTISSARRVTKATHACGSVIHSMQQFPLSAAHIPQHNHHQQRWPKDHQLGKADLEHIDRRIADGRCAPGVVDGIWSPEFIAVVRKWPPQ